VLQLGRISWRPLSFDHVALVIGFTSIMTVRVHVAVLPQVSVAAQQLTRLVVVDDEKPRAVIEAQRKSRSRASSTICAAAKTALTKSDCGAVWISYK
jgi:hypothetical protein